MEVTIKKHRLQFKRPSGTSRGVLTHKDSWFIVLREADKMGVGECSLIQGLSPDAQPNFQSKLNQIAVTFAKTQQLPDLQSWPAIKMGFETAIASLAAPQWWELYPSAFSQGNAPLSINGLVWMGDKKFMKDQISSLLDKGFRCLKLKIGALDFEEELALLKWIRTLFSPQDLLLRVDANGAFSPHEALEKLNRLSTFAIHSIEQPIAANQWEDMARLCAQTPVPIALDEELIGVYKTDKKETLLNMIKPQFLILKPSLLGGFKATEEWIAIAAKQNIDWWVTSALESNIGLNAIAQWTFCLQPNGPQGLGTGSLFTNNIQLPLQVAAGKLSIQKNGLWPIPF
jgi:o-succinylbenzoate synthase